MRVLILGGTGMLGHRLWINLCRNYETWVTVRGSASSFPDHPAFPKPFVRSNVDGLIFDEVTRAFASIQPDLVINCIGLIKQIPTASDPVSSLSLNAMLPHRVSLLCRTAGIRMIHISTDCVFAGKKGHYTESDQSDAEDLYGRSKFLGEVSYPHTVTLRTSIIGRELQAQYGLIEWFLARQGTIRGYCRASYTGFTTDELSRIIINHVIPQPNLSGVYHVSSETISKYELLMLVNEAFGRKIVIIPEEKFICDRSLDSTRFRQATGYKPPSWSKMISELAKDSKFYDEIRRIRCQ